MPRFSPIPEVILYSLYKFAERCGDSAIFLPGDSVLHAVFGEGTIISIDESSTVYEVQFANQEHPRHIEADKLKRKQTAPDLYLGD